MIEYNKTNYEIAVYNSLQLRPNNFDLIRLLAALQVILFHGMEHLQINPTGVFEGISSLAARFPGVPIFFVISGFLVSASYLRNSNLKQYGLSRVLRIFPGLWVCFFIALISITLVGYWATVSVPLPLFGLWVGAQMTIGQFFNPDFMRGYGVGVLNGSLWTIPVEVQFYILLPVVYLFIRKQSDQYELVIIGVIFVISFLVHLLLKQAILVDEETILTKLIDVSFIPHLYMFLFGVLLQHNWERLRPLLAGKAHYWLGGYLVSSVVLESVFKLNVTHNNINEISFFLLSITILSFAYSLPNLSDRILSGYDLSYGAYLYHMVVINAFVHLDLVGLPLYLLLVFAITLLLSIFSWSFVEKRALALKSVVVGGKVSHGRKLNGANEALPELRVKEK